jgi:phage shock protein B
MIELIIIIISIFLLLVFIIIPGSSVILIALFRGRKANKHQTEEAKRLQEYYQGLSSMEDRIDAIETILSDR